MRKLLLAGVATLIISQPALALGGYDYIHAEAQTSKVMARITALDVSMSTTMTRGFGQISGRLGAVVAGIGAITNEQTQAQARLQQDAMRAEGVMQRTPTRAGCRSATPSSTGIGRAVTATSVNETRLLAAAASWRGAAARNGADHDGAMASLYPYRSKGCTWWKRGEAGCTQEDAAAGKWSPTPLWPTDKTYKTEGQVEAAQDYIRSLVRSVGPEYDPSWRSTPNGRANLMQAEDRERQHGVADQALMAIHARYVPVAQLGQWRDAVLGGVVPAQDQATVSMNDYLQTEVLRRHANPAWHASLIDMRGDQLVRELVQIEALRSFMQLQDSQTFERISATLATILPRTTEIADHLDPDRDSPARK